MGPAPPSVLVVMGVSGSGKTTIAQGLADRLGWRFRDGDSFHPAANVAKMASGQPLTDADRKPWLEAIAAWIGETVAGGGHGIVACSALKKAYRDVLRRGHPDAVRFVFLDGSKALIGSRIGGRQGHFMPPALLDSQFAALEPPGPDERPIAVSIDAPPKALVDEIVRRLGEEAGVP